MDIPTPALIIDLSIAQQNIDRLAAYARTHNLKVRPHSKTHKSLLMGKRQLDAGAIGLAVAKVGEAEIMAQVANDLLVAYPTLDPLRSAALARLADGLTLRVAADSDQGVAALAAAAREAQTTIGIVVDIDVGHHRTGVQSAGASLQLAQLIDRTAGVRLDGMMCFPGHVFESDEKQAEILRNIGRQLQEAIDLWAKHGLQAGIVSGGSSPTAYQAHLVGPLTEIRPGTYIYNDMNMVAGNWCRLEDCAARVRCTVISSSVPGKVVLDAGTKALAADRHALHPESGFGHVVEYPQARIVRLSEEHAEIDITACSKTPRLGEQVHVIPNHICPCVNLHEGYWLRHEDGRLERQPVNARGRLF